MENTLLALSCGTPSDRRNQLRILWWTIGWMGTWLGLNAAISYGLMPEGPWAAAATLIPTVLGVGTVWAYFRFLQETDELRRKIELEAVALALGVGLVGGLSYWQLWRAGIFTEADLLKVISAMLVTYSLGVLFGLRRYA